VRQGVLLKYIRTVSDASHGCITDLEEEAVTAPTAAHINLTP
jgi:dihydroxy-acid dehydratase